MSNIISNTELVALEQLAEKTKKLYPTDKSENWDMRIKVLKRLKQEAMQRKDGQGIEPKFTYHIKSLCADNILYWFNMFCFTYDPRKKPSTIPFILYPFQEKYVTELQKAITDGHNLLVEKSRDMGISWLTVLTFQWFWMFRGEGNEFLLGSRKEELIDRAGALDTLFEKFRFNLKKQPKLFIPSGFRNRVHSKYMLFTNPETKSSIKGESTNPYFSSGGRYKAILFDEMAKVPKQIDESAWSAASDASPCKIAVSSANGKNNHFYKLRSGEAGEIQTLRFHWTEHPEKDENWYMAEKKRRSPADLASEVDINYAASVTNKAAESFDNEIHVKPVRYDENLELQLNCDFNIDPMHWCVSFTVHGHRYTFKEFYESTTVTETVIRKFIHHFRNHKNKTIYLYGDASGNYGSTNSRFSDWDIIVSTLRQEGWFVINRVPRKNPTHIDRINASNKRLCDWENNDKNWETIDNSCFHIIESLEQTQRKGNALIKNGYDHGFDAWSYGLEYEHPIIKRRIYQIKRQ